jgi:hypothetical protein
LTAENRQLPSQAFGHIAKNSKKTRHSGQRGSGEPTAYVLAGSMTTFSMTFLTLLGEASGSVTESMTREAGQVSFLR